MARPLVVITVFAGLLSAGSLSACGYAGASSGALRPADVRPALASLPYDIELRSVKPPTHDTAAYLGTAVGPHHTVLKFSIGLGGPALAVSLPGIGSMHAVSNGVAGFAFNSNSSVGEDFPSNAQWKEVAKMEVDIEEQLCRRAAGKSCPP